MEFLLAFAFAMFLSTLLVPFFMRYSVVLGLMDDPTEARKIHTESIPRCGGLGIIFGVFLASFYWLELSSEIITMAAAGAVIVVFGYLDDSRDLNYKWKFIGQILATLVLIAGGVVFVQVPFFGMDAAPAYIAYPFTLFFVLGVTNAVNLSDGLDGLAGGNSLLGLLLIALLSVQIGEGANAVIAMAVVGGVLGFLRYNTHPAKVFMGDTGSQFLGFTTAALAITLCDGDRSPINPMLPILVLGLPILDTLHVMIIRTMEGRSMFSPDKNHIHHRLLNLGFRHYEVVAVLYSMQLTLLFLAYTMRFEADWLLLFAYVLFCVVVLGFLYWGQFSGWQLRKHLELQSDKERRSSVFRRFDWYYKNSARVIQLMLALFIGASAWYLADLNSSQLPEILLSLMVILPCVLVARRYGSVLLNRTLVYIVSILIAYGFMVGVGAQSAVNYVIDGYLLLLLLALLLGIRMTRKALFRLDTHDYLVFALLLVLPLFPFEQLNDESLARMVLRWALLIYSCEFLLSKNLKGNLYLEIITSASLIILTISLITFQGFPEVAIL